MHKLVDYVCDELEELERKVDKGNKLSMSEVQYADTLAHMKKNLLKADEMMEEDYSGYDGNSYARDGRGGQMPYERGGNRGGMSYARGRRGNVRRDSMGRYSREGGYSMDGDEFVMELQELMESAPDERTKMKIEKMIREMNQV